ncbi:surface-associated interspersed protein 4.2 (SURFIN 4.2) (SURF4.2) [Plasmodium ovale wallikeri]|uniref:Surface-associated interspersed protein 4.2 (SURFIN 4.2) (SURF4.2) n=1 Tax=Plasmodium ovale wallikeri TaxID=864142 RepID=A0A1A9AI03_PLAOA|nr:surface-associated interspersed protein 4.2 (SURFIN 4.2) (SURF4.2) [Plasmodium ovale wallikeri]
MTNYQGYTTRTHDIDINVFLAFIQGDIKNLIREYGHKSCGLRHEELCKEINKIITDKKRHILSFLNPDGKKRLNSEWNSQRKGFFDKLFEEEGFINMCYPYKNIGNQSLYQLKSKHIKFCKKRDSWKATVEKDNEYNECVTYNQWVIAEIKSLTNEFLQNVSDYSHGTVKKYFSTKKHPGGHDPRDTYRNSRLDCNKYNPPPKSHPQIPEAKSPTNKLQPSMKPNIIRDSQGKDTNPVTYGDSAGAKTKPEANTFPNAKPPTVDSQLLPQSKTQPDDIPTGQDTPVRHNAPAPPVNVEGAKNESSNIHNQPPTGMPRTVQAEASPKDSVLQPVVQLSPSPTATTYLPSSPSPVNDTTSSLTITPDLSIKSGSLLSADQRLPSPVTKGQDGAPKATTASDTLETTHHNQSVLSTAPVDSSLPPPQSPLQTVLPAVTTAERPGTFISSSANTITTTTAATHSVAISTMNTTQEHISSIKQVPSVPSSQESPPLSASREPKATEPITVAQAPTSLSVSNNGGVSVPTETVTDDRNKQTPLSSETNSKHKDTRHAPGSQLSNIISQSSEQKPDKGVAGTEVKLQRSINQIDQMHITSPVQTGTNRNDQLTTHVGGDPGKIPDVKSGKDPKNISITPKEKNDNPNIIPEGLTPLKHIIPTLLYTPFGFLLGRRRKRRKRDLRSTFVIPEESTYESPNIALHEWEDHKLVGQTVENDVYTKLLKINRYKQEMKKRKKENKKTLIEVHMEVLEEYKSDEWELHKGDFLEICLRGFINEENNNYSKLQNSDLTVKNTKKAKTIEDIQKQEILWNTWIDNHRNILEQWKKEEWFQILKNKWSNEEQKYKKKNNKLQKNISNEQDTHSIVSQKEIWKQWISKQATLVDMFNKEDWFKSIVYAQDKKKDNHRINEYNNNSVTSKSELKNEKI